MQKKARSSAGCLGSAQPNYKHKLETTRAVEKKKVIIEKEARTMSSPRKIFALVFLESGVLEEITRPTYGKFLIFLLLSQSDEAAAWMFCV